MKITKKAWNICQIGRNGKGRKRKRGRKTAAVCVDSVAGVPAKPAQKDETLNFLSISPISAIDFFPFAQYLTASSGGIRAFYLNNPEFRWKKYTPYPFFMEEQS